MTAKSPSLFPTQTSSPKSPLPLSQALFLRNVILSQPKWPKLQSKRRAAVTVILLPSQSTPSSSLPITRTKLLFQDSISPKVTFDIVFIQRQIRGNWGGHIAFPGGHLEPNESLFQCAIRETREEIEINLHNPEYDYLCQLDDVFPVVQSSLVVSVFVFIAHHPLKTPINELKLSKDEIYQVFTVPLEFFLNPKKHSIQQRWIQFPFDSMLQRSLPGKSMILSPFTVYIKSFLIDNFLLKRLAVPEGGKTLKTAFKFPQLKQFFSDEKVRMPLFWGMSLGILRSFLCAGYPQPSNLWFHEEPLYSRYNFLTKSYNKIYHLSKISVLVPFNPIISIFFILILSFILALIY